MDCNSQAAHLYNRLQDGQLRLLSLKARPVDNDSSIYLALQTFDRENAPKYSALSYEWGPPPNTEEIRLNGEPFLIRTNLCGFFKQVMQRRRQKWRYLWIDAVCINQDDVEERNEQVRVMDQIYRNAASVVVWLGENQHAPSCRFGRSHLIFSVKLRIALVHLTYWSRAWIIQELRLAGKVDFMWGPWEFDWGWIVQWTGGFVYMLIGPGAGSDDKPDDEVYKMRLRDRVETRPSWEWFVLAIDQSPNTAGNMKQTASLQVLLAQHSLSYCSDPRDRIFAILGLLQPHDRRILDDFFPDYSMTFTRVMMLVFACLKQENSPSSAATSSTSQLNIALSLGISEDDLAHINDFLAQLDILDAQRPAALDHYEERQLESQQRPKRRFLRKTHDNCRWDAYLRDNQEAYEDWVRRRLVTLRRIAAMDEEFFPALMCSRSPNWVPPNSNAVRRDQS